MAGYQQAPAGWWGRGCLSSSLSGSSPLAPASAQLCCREQAVVNIVPGSTVMRCPPLRVTLMARTIAFLESMPGLLGKAE